MTTTPESARTKYLRKTFAMNPVWSAAEVMELRSRALGIKRLNESETPNEKVIQSRDAARRQLSRLQSEFWKMPIDQLKAQLNAMGEVASPEFAPAIKRLKTVAASRSQFPQLAQESWMDSNLFTAFKNAVVLPPSEASFYRNRFASRIADKKQLRRIKASTKRLEKEYPVLFGLERDWFQTLRKHKLHAVSSSSTGGGFDFEMPELGWPTFIVITIVIRILLRMLMG